MAHVKAMPGLISFGGWCACCLILVGEVELGDYLQLQASERGASTFLAPKRLVGTSSFFFLLFLFLRDVLSCVELLN